MDLALRLLDGTVDERQIARVSALDQNPDVVAATEPGRKRDAGMATRQQEWLAARGKASSK